MKLRLIALFFALSMLFTLVGCEKAGGTTSETTVAATDENGTPAPTPIDVRIQTLNGTTGFGMAKLMEDAANGIFTTENYSFEVQSDASVVLNALATGSVDIAALPTNAASTIYNRTKGGVKILAINTLGCLYLLNTGSEKVESFADLAGKTVYVPAQNPTFIFTYLCQQNGLTIVTDDQPGAGEICIDSTSYAQPANLRDAVASGSVTLAVLPEPMVTIAVNKGKTATDPVTVNIEMDLTAEWDKIPGKAGSLVQGCVVVRKAFLEEHPDAVANFLTAYKASIEYLNANAEETATLIAEHGIFENANVAKQAIPKCNVKFVDGAEMKTAVSAYLEILNGIKSDSIGGTLPGDDFYYSK